MKKASGFKRLAIGATVVGAFVAGAIAGVRKNKVKEFAAKAGRKVKSKARKVTSAALNRISDATDEALT